MYEGTQEHPSPAAGLRWNMGTGLPGFLILTEKFLPDT